MTVGYQPDRVECQWHFHWKFWEPVQCVGEKVYFGWWGDITTWEDGECDTTRQSYHQYQLKKMWGLY